MEGLMKVGWRLLRNTRLDPDGVGMSRVASAFDLEGQRLYALHRNFATLRVALRPDVVGPPEELPISIHRKQDGVDGLILRTVVDRDLAFERGESLVEPIAELG